MIMKRIKKLSVNLINQIAAGEVIERPYSVVKELVENSVDAGATKIEINISNECRNIRIADNGSGIHPDDIELAFSKHATSKLTDEASLFNIKTLGFRGEALASIISIAKVTCTTRTKDFDYGTKVISQNSVVNASQAGCAKGTIMEVNDLFFNQPARLKFLKSAKTEFSYIQELVQSLALSNPKIAFILKNNNQTVISTTCNADLLTRITELFPNNIINELKEVAKTDDLTGIKLTGYITTPEYTRSSKKTMYTFVNSRTIKCPIIMKAIDIAYKNMMPQGRYPFVVLNLDINPEEIDVNAHPTKREIRYKNPNQIFNFVQSAISYTLNAAVQNQTPFPQKDTKIIDFNSYTSIDFQKNNQENDPDDYEISLNTLQRITDKPGLLYEKADEAEQKKIEINFEQPSKLKQINVIGQFKNTYILVENEDNLELIDQHIAQERYIYEKLKNQKEAASQLLIISDVLDVMPEEIDILENAKSHLNKYGYKIDKISNNQIIFRKIPQILSKVKPQDILSELLENLKDAPENELDTTEERILITTACKASVKAGERLTLWQMEEIVKQLRSTKNPYTCPHGRPISHFISHKEIASFFARSLEKKEK